MALKVTPLIVERLSIPSSAPSWLFLIGVRLIDPLSLAVTVLNRGKGDSHGYLEQKAPQKRYTGVVFEIFENMPYFLEEHAVFLQARPSPGTVYGETLPQ